MAIVIGCIVAVLGLGLPAQDVAHTVSGKKRRAYLGFDRNDYPGDDALARLRKTFSFASYWLNNPPGEKSNTWKGKRQILDSAGFGFAVLFTGKTYAELKSGDTSALGKHDGLSGVEAAKTEGFRNETTIFLDQEEGGRLLPEQKAYIYAWVDAVTAANYRAGVYCSGIPFTEPDGTVIITADDIRLDSGQRKIAYWVANDRCPPSPGCSFPAIPPKPNESGIVFANVWQYAQSPRRPQYTAACRNRYSTDGNCYPSGLSGRVHVDVDTATSPDPSFGRTIANSSKTR
jgi:hypothetical protein